MKIKLLSIFLCFVTSLQAEPIGSTQLTSAEAELAKLINDFRQQNGQPRIPVSKSLTYVARWHVWDAVSTNAIQGNCNLHSWSNAKPNLWDAVCYDNSLESARQMWNKPRQITRGAFSGDGYENSAWSSGNITAQTAFNLWKNSGGHRDLMLEQGIFSQLDLNSMGVGIENGYAFAWFASEADPQGTFSTSGTQPQNPAVFFDSFE